jgi:hypothetical protein
VVYESGVPSNVVWTSSEVLKSGSDSDLTFSLFVDAGLEIFLTFCVFVKKRASGHVFLLNKRRRRHRIL